MKAYLNWKMSEGRETVDQLDSDDIVTGGGAWSDYKAFKAEKARLLQEYQLAFGYGELYWSQRCCKNWSK